MPTARAIRGVLNGFLGTYTSRYTDYRGYWLFGFIVAELGELTIDLLDDRPESQGSPRSAALSLAASKFAEQMTKVGFARSQLREAWLMLRKLPEPVRGPVNGHWTNGHNVAFEATAVTSGGARHKLERVVFVAPHDAALERRSARAT